MARPLVLSAEDAITERQAIMAHAAGCYDGAANAYWYTCPEGSYSAPSLWRLWWEVVSHRFWHWRRGDGWVD